MAVRGRKPLPSAIKELEGDRSKGKSPYNKNEPKPPQNNIECPDWLMPEAKEEWERLAPSLIAMGVLSEHDILAFAGYCQAYARWREAEEWMTRHTTIMQTKSGYIQQVPQVAIAASNLKIMQSLGAEFGLTPSSRSRIFSGIEEKKEAEDPMETVLGGGWKLVQ